MIDVEDEFVVVARILLPIILLKEHVQINVRISIPRIKFKHDRILLQ